MASSVALYWGADGFLLREKALRFLSGHGVDADEVRGAEWRGDEVTNLSTPSLFGERRGLFVSGAEGLPAAAVAEVGEYVRAPAPDAALAVTLVTGGRTVPALAKAVKQGGGLVEQVALKPKELPIWVGVRARDRGADLSSAAAGTLVDVVGEDAATLDQAVEQLVNAFPGRRIGPPEVHQQFKGLGERKVWTLCDQAFSGKAGDALVTLRSLLADRQEGVMILGGISSRLRDLIRVRSLPPGTPAGRVAKEAGLRFDWQGRNYLRQASRYPPGRLAEIMDSVVECDRALKSGVPEDVALPELVIAMARAGRAAG